MHVTARVAGQEEVDVEVGEACRTIQALKEAVVVALPQLRVEGFDVSVGGRALDDEGVVSLEHGSTRPRRSANDASVTSHVSESWRMPRQRRLPRVPSAVMHGCTPA